MVMHHLGRRPWNPTNFAGDGYSSWGITTTREEEKDNSFSLAISQINHRII
jgi:hypothetical protein